jgi:hypothetical protein
LSAQDHRRQHNTIRNLELISYSSTQQRNGARTDMGTESAPQPFSSAPCKHQTRTQTDTSKTEPATTNSARGRRSNTSDTNKWIQPPIGPIIESLC